jgi:hypothetical protein
MDDELLSAREAARRLGLATASLYAWLAQSNAGRLCLRGRPVTIAYFQGGPQGQGRIRIEACEVDRLKELLRVQPRPLPFRRPPLQPASYPGIHVPLGRPGQTSPG